MRRVAALAWLCALLLAPGATGAPLRVAVISDLNGAYGSTRYEASVAHAVGGIVALKPDLVLSTGDMVAGQRLHPPLSRDAVAAMWTSFHAAVTAPLQAAGIPLAVTPGNHDASAYPAFRAERELYAAEWEARRPSLRFVDAERYPFHYAFAVDEVLFVSLDVTRVGRLDGEQLVWLDALLARHGREFRHRVVFSHLPIHAFTQGRETEISGDAELERLLAQHGVELYLSGHHHAFYPGWHAGIRHVSQACLGAAPRALLGTHVPSPRAVTWLEFDGADLRIAALTGPRLAERVDIAALPREIRSASATLVRDDLRPGARSVSPAATASGASP